MNINETIKDRIDRLVVYKYDDKGKMMELPKNIVADTHKKLLFVTTNQELYSYNISAKKEKKCTHQHVSRGICLYCGEEGVE